MSIPTLRKSVRFRAVSTLLDSLGLIFEPEEWMVHGSASLALADPTFSREPDDVDLVFANKGLIDRLYDFETKEVSISYVGAVPFRGNRIVDPASSFVATVRNTQGTILDRFLVEASEAPGRLAWRVPFSDLYSRQSVYLHLADKYHSYMRVRLENRINMRWTDLGDTQVLCASRHDIASDLLYKARDFVLSRTPANSLHVNVPDPPSEWLAAWRKFSAIDSPDNTWALADAVGTFSALWTVPARTALWLPGDCRWS